jgi:GNAT superfamily N-acetyltransferase
MPEDVAIRKATLADRSAIIAFHLSLYIDHRERVMPPALDPLFAHRAFATVLRDDVDAMLRDRATFVLLAERGGAPVGYVTGTMTHDPRRVLPRKGIVGDWYVDEAARGLGIGAALVDALERRFVEAGCQVMESATWSFNPGARAAHLALGFHEVQVTYRKALPAPLAPTKPEGDGP